MRAACLLSAEREVQEHGQQHGQDDGDRQHRQATGCAAERAHLGSTDSHVPPFPPSHGAHPSTSARCWRGAGVVSAVPEAPVAVSVRIADERDVDHLTSLRRRWNEEWHETSIDDAGFDARFRAWWVAERTTRTFFLAELDGAPVGMANVKRYTRMPAAGMASAGEWGYVGNVFVLAEQRNARIGQALMERIVDWAGDEGLEHLRLAPSERSIPFYARLGFVPGAVVELDPPAPG